MSRPDASRSTLRTTRSLEFALRTVVVIAVNVMVVALVSSAAAAKPPARTVGIVGDTSVLEGNVGTQSVTFVIELSRQAPTSVTVNYRTDGGTATAGVDYVALSGTLSFERGTRALVTITVNSDRRFESDETFTLLLTNAVNATISTGTGTATIVNDDPDNLAVVAATSTVEIPRRDSCGNDLGRTCESLVGNVVADSMRTAFAATYPIDFAIMISGGIRSALTCPTVDLDSDFCPSFVPPPYPITYAQTYSVLPFENTIVTVVITGAELRQMLENGVSLMPTAAGRFPQVSGLCFSYDIARAAGERVLSAVRHIAGTCSTTAVDLSSALTYRIATNSFVARGGEFYPNLADRAEAPYVITDAERLADYLAEHPGASISPAIEGRITSCNGCHPL